MNQDSKNLIWNPTEGEPLNLEKEISKLPAMQQEKHHRVVGAILDGMGVKPEQITDARALWNKIREIDGIVYNVALLEDAHNTTQPFATKAQLMGERVSQEFAARLSGLSKDEMYFILVKMLTENTVSKFY